MAQIVKVICVKRRFKYSTLFHLVMLTIASKSKGYGLRDGGIRRKTRNFEKFMGV